MKWLKKVEVIKLNFQDSSASNEVKWGFESEADLPLRMMILEICFIINTFKSIYIQIIPILLFSNSNPFLMTNNIRM